MLPCACNFLSIGCDFTRWGKDGDRNRVGYPLGYASSGIVYFVTPAWRFFRRSITRSLDSIADVHWWITAIFSIVGPSAWNDLPVELRFPCFPNFRSPWSLWPWLGWERLWVVSLMSWRGAIKVSRVNEWMNLYFNKPKWNSRDSLRWLLLDFSTFLYFIKNKFLLGGLNPNTPPKCPMLAIISQWASLLNLVRLFIYSEYYKILPICLLCGLVEHDYSLNWFRYVHRRWLFARAAVLELR